jgi:DNA-binding transcriptional regulator YiaG
MLGVSKVLVQSWEQGARRPSRLARRLLDEINARPHHWAALVRPRPGG